MNLLHKILHLLNLDSETDDFGRINQSISKDSEFKGTNLWILMIAIVIASVGLNMNSTAQFSFFFGAMYLFTINTVFIALSSVIVSKILKLPIIAEIDQAKKKKINNWITITIIVILVPSIYFGYNLVQNEKFNERALKYVKSVGMIDGNYLLNSEISPSNPSIKLIYAGSKRRNKEKHSIESC